MGKENHSDDPQHKCADCGEPTSKFYVEREKMVWVKGKMISTKLPAGYYCEKHGPPIQPRNAK